MKRFLLALALAWSWAATAQPILRSALTTNSFSPTTNGVLFIGTTGQPLLGSTTASNAFLMKQGSGYTFVNASSNVWSIGGGTLNTLPKWTSTNALGDSALSDDGAILLYTNGTFSFGPPDGSVSSFDIIGTTVTNGSAPINLAISSGALDGSLTGPGGDIVLTGRDAVGTNDDNGGSIFIIGGLATGSGSPGGFDVNVPGDWSLTAGGNAFLTAALLFDISAPVVTHDGAITLSGTTNRYTDDGSTLLRNGVAIAGTSDTTWSNRATLTMTGTNVSAVDFSLIQGGGSFKLVLTGNAYFGSPTGVSSSIQQKGRIWIQQPSTGTCIVKWTNGAPGYAWPEGFSPTVDTNGGAVSYVDLWNDPFTNGILHGTMVPFSKLATNL